MVYRVCVRIALKSETLQGKVRPRKDEDLEAFPIYTERINGGA